MSLHEVIESALSGDSPRIIRLIRSETNAGDESVNERSPLAGNAAMNTAPTVPTIPRTRGISDLVRSFDYTNLFTWVMMLLILKFIIGNLLTFM